MTLKGWRVVKPQHNQSFTAKSLDTTEWMNGEQRPWWYFAHAQDLNLHILRMFEGIFLLDAA